MKELIARFLALLDQPPPADAALLQKLAQILDGLTHAMGDLPEGRQDLDAPDPPGLDQDALRRKICRLFPGFGFYPSVDPLTNLAKGMPEIGIDDAIDDIVDIANDLTDAEWRFSHTSDLDAHWSLHFFYRHHWGRHLMNLRSYLHAMLHEQTRA